ncbi:MAG: phage capsid protein [bacterium]
MAITIDSAFINEYEDNVRHLAQQMGTRLRPYVLEVASGGEAYNFERLGPTDAVEKTGRRVPTEWIDDDWSRRVAQPRTFNHTMTVEHEDRVQMLVNPDSNYAYNQAMAMNREIDKLIIEACSGDALDGEGTLNPIPASQIIGDGTEPISFDLVTASQEQFMKDEIMPDQARVMVVGPTQVRKLMQLTENTSADYVRANQLQQYGIAPNWLGYNWVVSNLLEAPAAGELYCLTFTSRGPALAVNQNTFTRISENPSYSYMWQVFSQWTMGAVRVEDEHVQLLHVADEM